MFLFLLVLILSGLVVGALARLALPGPDPMSIGMTIALGVAGSLLGGLVVGLLFHRRAGLFGSVLGAVAILAIVRRTNRSSSTT